jgi:hypothetical protein
MKPTSLRGSNPSGRHDHGDFHGRDGRLDHGRFHGCDGRVTGIGTQVTDDTRLPGEPPHIPNWRPAKTAGEYLTNCLEGLETWSERRYSKLSGIPRIELWRAKNLAAIPQELFERLLEQTRKSRRLPSIKHLAAVGAWLLGEDPCVEVERCPHCGEVTRVRAPWNKDIVDVVNQWLAKKSKAKAA